MKSKNEKTRNQIAIAFIIVLLFSISIVFLFQFVTKTYIKIIFDYYQLSLNETIAIYEIEKQTNLYIFLAIAFVILTNIIWIIISYLKDKKEKARYQDILKNIENIRQRNYQFTVNEMDKSLFSAFQNELYQTMIQLQEYGEEVATDKKKLANYLSDISHQLRTPLLSLTISVDSLLKDDIKLEEKDRQLLYNISKQLDKMRWLVESLLKMAQLDTKTVKLKKEQISIQEVLQAALQNLEILLEIKNQTIKIQENQSITITGDFKWTTEAFINILKNASEHSENETEIYVYCKENPLFAEIIIQDKGCGISKEDLPHIFDRFYKGKNANVDSFGIGLSLAKDIIIAQNGEIQVESEIEQGTKFIIRFPK